MSSLDDLRSAGFSDDEVNTYAAQKRSTLSAAGFSDDEVNSYLGAAPKPAPDMAAGNRVFAKTWGDALGSIEGAKSAASQVGEGALKTVTDIGSLYAPLEAAFNAGTGMLVGFPAALTAAAGALGAKHLLGADVDPKEVFDTVQKFGTYQPQTDRGIRLTGNVMMPLQALNDAGEWSGHYVADKTGSAGLGAITESTTQMLPYVLLGEAARKMGGQTVGSDDMQNVAKVLSAPDDAGMRQGQQNNTFRGQPSGAGSQTGFTQPPGTPTTKLFSNFADNKGQNTDAFRAGMFDRANADPKAFTNDPVSSSEHPFSEGLSAKIDAADSGKTRVQITNDAGDVVAAAQIRRGMLDSIAVRGDEKGAGIGKDLLAFLDDNKLANVDEVPDRSPGFVRIQKQVIDDRNARQQAIENSLHSTYEKTGIGPYSVAEAAAKDPNIHADLLNPAVDVPKALEEFIPKGDGTLDPKIDAFVGNDANVDPEARAYTMNTVDAMQEAQKLVSPEQFAELAEKRMGRVSSDKWEPARAAQVEMAARGIVDFYDKNPDYPKTGPTPGDGAPLLDLTDTAGRTEPRMQPDDIPTETFQEHGLIDSADTRQKVAIATEAARIDPDAVRAAAAQFAEDEPGFHNAIQEIIDGNEKAEQGAGDGERSPVTGEEPAATPVPADGAEPGSIGSDPGQPSSATYRDGAGTLNAGLNPAAILRDARDGYSNYVGVIDEHAKPPAVDSQGKPVNRFADDLRRVLAPASRGELASEQAGIMRANFGEMAHENAVAETRLFDYAKTFDRMPVAENVKFIDAYEHGTPLTDPKLNAAAAALKSMNDGLREQIQGLGKGQLENFDENYLGRIWKDPETAGRDLYARRPLEGSKNFLKARTIPYYTDGLQWRAYDSEGEFVKSFPTEVEAKMASGTEGRVGAPLEPITTNPVEMALLKGKEMRKYIYGQKIFQEMKDADLARFVGFGQQALPGWTKIDDKIAHVLQPNEGEGGGMILRGEYYGPDEAATLINNHLSPSALQGNSLFEAWRTLGNAVNALQLGLSFFHVGFTSMDAIISKAALGIKQISRGDVLEGLGNVGMSLTGPVQSLNNLLKGDRLLRAYNGGMDAPELSPLVQAVQDAGGRVKTDDFYRNASVNAFRQALRNEQYRSATKAFLPTVLDRISAPIFEWLVPRQKLGVFADMANDWIKNNPDADRPSRRAELGKLWDSVDNRMGQLVYDNVFWNRTLKDGLMASVRSVGWNLGTFREIGGGLLDIKDIAANKGFSDRTAYVVALPALAAVYGSVMHYLYNGEPPDDLKDAFYPRTGRLRPDGSPDRVSLPTYMKDVFAYGEDATNFAKYGSDPTQTLKNKANPLISTVSQMLNNQDYFGGAIRNPADPATKQMMDEAAYILQQVEPFSLRNYEQQAKQKGEEPSAMGYLTSPSMVGITPAPGYITKTPEQNESAQVSRMREPLIQKYREALKDNSISQDDAIKEMIKGGLSKGDIKYVIKSSGETPKPSRLKKFGAE